MSASHRSRCSAQTRRRDPDSGSRSNGDTARKLGPEAAAVEIIRADGQVKNGLTARDALCLLVGRMLTVLDEAPSAEESQQSVDDCIELLKGVPVGSTYQGLPIFRNSFEAGVRKESQ